MLKIKGKYITGIISKNYQKENGGTQISSYIIIIINTIAIQTDTH